MTRLRWLIDWFLRSFCQPQSSASDPVLSTIHAAYIPRKYARPGIAEFGSILLTLAGRGKVPCLRLLGDRGCVKKQVGVVYIAHGRLVLTVGSFFPCIYYAFYCETHYQVLYLGIITIAGLGGIYASQDTRRETSLITDATAGAAYIVLNPQYGKNTHRKARTYVFIALGLSSILPVSHAFVAHGFRALCIEMGFHWLLTSGALYITGALL